MADETETTGEVARVLNLHASFKASAEIQDPNTPWYWECDGCDTRLVLSGTYGRPEVVAALAKHQAAMLAEAGLLRSYDPDAECGVCGGTRDRAEMWRRIANRMDYALAEMMPTLRKIFSDATENERQMLDAFDVLIEQARDGNGDPQIAASVPAGQPAAGSAGRRGSGGLDGAPAGSLGSQLRFASLVAASTEGTRWIQELSREADRLENEAEMQGHSARTWRVQAEQALAQVEAIRGQIAYEARHGDAITRCNLVAERFQTVLDSVTKPVTNENEGA